MDRIHSLQYIAIQNTLNQRKQDNSTRVYVSIVLPFPFLRIILLSLLYLHCEYNVFFCCFLLSHRLFSFYNRNTHIWFIRASILSFFSDITDRLDWIDFLHARFYYLPSVCLSDSFCFVVLLIIFLPTYIVFELYIVVALWASFYIFLRLNFVVFLFLLFSLVFTFVVVVVVVQIRRWHRLFSVHL